MSVLSLYLYLLHIPWRNLVAIDPCHCLPHKDTLIDAIRLYGCEMLLRGR